MIIYSKTDKDEYRYPIRRNNIQKVVWFKEAYTLHKHFAADVADLVFS